MTRRAKASLKRYSEHSASSWSELKQGVGPMENELANQDNAEVKKKKTYEKGNND